MKSAQVVDYIRLILKTISRPWVLPGHTTRDGLSVTLSLKDYLPGNILTDSITPNIDGRNLGLIPVQGTAFRPNN